MEKRKVAPHALAAGIVFALMAVIWLIIGVSEPSIFSLIYLLSAVGYVMTAITIFKANRARPNLLVIGFIIQAAATVLVLILGIIVFYPAIILSKLFMLVAWIGAIIISVVCLTERQLQYRSAVKKCGLFPRSAMPLG